MSNIPSEILLLILLLLFNGIFVMSEMAVVSARKARLQQKANEGSKPAAAALTLAQNPSVFLSTVQIVITLFGILFAALARPAFSAPLPPLFKSSPAPVPYAVPLTL